MFKTKMLILIDRIEIRIIFETETVQDDSLIMENTVYSETVTGN